MALKNGKVKISAGELREMAEKQRKMLKNTRGYYPYAPNNLVGDKTTVDMRDLSPETVRIGKLDEMRDKYIAEVVRLVESYRKMMEKFNKKFESMNEKARLKKIDGLIKKNFRKADLMKIDNFISTEQKVEDGDLKSLAELGLGHYPVTKKGKTLKLLEYLKKFYLDNNLGQALTVNLRLMEESFVKILCESPKLREKYKRYLDWLKTKVSETDMVKYQMVVKHEMMPPLNEKGFVALDDWQEQAIDCMRENKSLILSIPTSGGKTYLSAYLTKFEGRILFLAPSIPLARQVAAYLTRVSGESVPFMTDTYRPFIFYEEMLACLMGSKIIVSTPDVMLDFLPEIDILTKEDNLIVDEIHMMGSNQGDSMETIAILNHNAKLLGLSATVSNPGDLIKWRENLGESLEIITSHKRFFNLGTGYWDKTTGTVMTINPLALLTIEDFISGDVLKKDLKPTPPDIYELAMKVEAVFGDDMGDLIISSYFKKAESERLTLHEAMEYFRKLIVFMTEKTSEEREKIELIINDFTPLELEEEETDILQIVDHLYTTKNTPVLIFQRNTYSLMRLARKLIAMINDAENKKYPERMKELLKREKEAKKRQKEMERAGIVDDGVELDGKAAAAKAAKIEKIREASGLEEILVEHHQKPQKGFYYTSSSLFSQSEIETIEYDLKKYFPRDGDYFHPIIHALWRGIGIYAEGLPDDYLVMVQVLANQKKLGVVLSDKSMTFGVSMPFRNVVIYRDPTTEDDLNPLLFKQMEGRAGRRGQDTKGSVIFAGYSWARIQELSVSEIPKIEGQDSIENIYLPIGQKLAEITGNVEYDFKQVMTHNLSRIQNPEDEPTTFEEYEELWKEWTPVAMEGNKDYLRMLWHSRNFGCDGVAFYHLVDALEKYFHGGDISEMRQITAALILSFFIQNKPAKKKSHILTKPKDYDSNWKGIRHKLIEMGIPLEDDDSLDGRVFYSVQRNLLLEGVNDSEFQEIRENFFVFSNILRVIQNYCYYSKRVTLARILGKLYTRCKWILWTSSPLTNFSKEEVYLEEIPDDEIIYEE